MENFFISLYERCSYTSGNYINNVYRLENRFECKLVHNPLNMEISFVTELKRTTKQKMNKTFPSTSIAPEYCTYSSGAASFK